MSDNSTRDHIRKKVQAKRKNARILLACSVIISLMIMAWALSMPFRSGNLNLSEARDPDKLGAGDGGGGEASYYSDADELRDAVLAMDREFMERRRERTRLHKVRGSFEVKHRWQRHAQQVQEEIRQLGEPERGTIEWQAQQELIKSLQEDIPL